MANTGALQCVICLAGAEEDHVFSALPCGHIFHSACVAQEIEVRGKCPNCRKVVKRSRDGSYMQRLYPTLVSAEETLDLANDQPTDGPSATDHEKIRLRLKLQSQDDEILRLKLEASEYKGESETLKAEKSQLNRILEQKEAEIKLSRDNLINANKRIKELSNTVANYSTKLKKHDGDYARFQLAFDTSLVGPRLGKRLAELAKVDEPLHPQSELIRSILEARNKQISESNTRAERAERDKYVLEADLKERLQKAQARIAELEQSRQAHPADSFGTKRPRQDENTSDRYLPSFTRQQKQQKKAAFTMPTEDEVILVDDDDELDIQPDDSCGSMSYQQRNQDSDSLVSSKPLASLINAGPSRLGMNAAPGKSFIKRVNQATTGLTSDAKFVHHGPDGKGGVATFYSSKGVTSRPSTAAAPAKSAKLYKASMASKSLSMNHFFSKK